MLNTLDRNPNVRKITTFPGPAWKTPDGHAWTPQEVLVAWGGPRVSDAWACTMLASWVQSGKVTVFHVELPEPLSCHDPNEPAWRFVTELGSDSEREVTVMWGRADLAVEFPDEKGPLFVEFGTCPPGKFVLNLGTTGNDQMIVPYGCPYGFIFRPKREFMPLLGMPDPEDLLDKKK